MHRDSLGTEIADPPRCAQPDERGARPSPIPSAPPPTCARRARSCSASRSWVALAEKDEEGEPGFVHYAADRLPVLEGEGKTVRLIAGSALGATSPVATSTATLYADAILAAGATIPFDADYDERAIYTVSGEVDIAGDRFGPGQLLVFRPGEPDRHPRGLRHALHDAGRRADGRAAPHLVEFRLLAARAHRGGQERLARGPLSPPCPARRSSFRCRGGDRPAQGSPIRGRNRPSWGSRFRRALRHRG